MPLRGTKDFSISQNARTNQSQWNDAEMAETMSREELYVFLALSITSGAITSVIMWPTRYELRLGLLMASRTECHTDSICSEEKNEAPLDLLCNNNGSKAPQFNLAYSNWRTRLNVQSAFLKSTNIIFIGTLSYKSIVHYCSTMSSQRHVERKRGEKGKKVNTWGRTKEEPDQWKYEPTYCQCKIKKMLIECCINHVLMSQTDHTSYVRTLRKICSCSWKQREGRRRAAVQSLSKVHGEQKFKEVKEILWIASGKRILHHWTPHLRGSSFLIPRFHHQGSNWQ